MKKIDNAVVETGDFSWRGHATSFTQAIKFAFAKIPPANPSILVRVSLNGIKAEPHKRRGVWQYISLESALRIAGWRVRKNLIGFTVHGDAPKK